MTQCAAGSFRGWSPLARFRIALMPREDVLWVRFLSHVNHYADRLDESDTGVDVDLGDGLTAHLALIPRDLSRYVRAYVSAGFGFGPRLVHGLPMPLIDDIDDCLGSQDLPHVVYGLVGWDIRAIGPP